MADKKVSDNTTTVIEPKGDNVGANAVDMDKKIREIMNKPDSQLTEEEKAFKKKFLEAQTKGVLEPWMELFKSAEFALLFGPFNARAIISAIAKDMAMDEIIKYANEKFPGYGAIGIALAALALSAAKVIKGIKGFSRATAKDAAKAEGPILERKAAEKAEKAATDAEKATLNAEKKASEEAAKRADERGKIYDETVHNKYDPKAVERKKANIFSHGDINADEAARLNEEAAKAGSSTKFDGYKAEATQKDIEHSMIGHSKDKVEIAKKREASGEKIGKTDKIPENEIKGKGGKYNMPLKKEDYQKIEEYRKEAYGKDGRIVFQPANKNKEFETIEYQLQKDGGVIHMIYEVDPVNKKMKFVTMYKVETRKLLKSQ
ncbi:MAG: hypothetical protein L7F77_11045 [Candidatus Magnetominusculus sp. LBB02]|nr:hypothetical protein [Candidatus Magnetominusculus sp. LBB02]